MENLEETLVTLTADTVQKVMIESRKTLLDHSQQNDMPLVA